MHLFWQKKRKEQLFPPFFPLYASVHIKHMHICPSSLFTLLGGLRAFTVILRF